MVNFASAISTKWRHSYELRESRSRLTRKSYPYGRFARLHTPREIRSNCGNLLDQTLHTRFTKRCGDIIVMCTSTRSNRSCSQRRDACAICAATMSGRAPVDDIIAEVHKQQSNKKRRNTNPLPRRLLHWGWCRGHASKQKADTSRIGATSEEPSDDERIEFQQGPGDKCE